MSRTASFPAFVTASEAESCFPWPQPRPPLPFPATTIAENRAIFPFLVIFLTTRILTRRVINFDEAEKGTFDDSPYFLRFEEINCEAVAPNDVVSGAEDEKNRLNKNGNIGNFLGSIKVHPGGKCLN